MLSIPPPNFKNRKGYGQNATLIRGNAGSSTVHGSNGSSAINKKAQGVGLLAVRDFVITPYQGEPPRTEQFLKELLDESNLKFVLQGTDAGQQLQKAGGFFIKDNFYFIDDLIPPCPRHIAGESEA